MSHDPSTPRLAAVVSIASAPSFTGTVHEPDWRTFTIVCLSTGHADELAEHLRTHRLPAERNGREVSVRYDHTQPLQRRSTPLEIALAASAMGYAEASIAADALTAHCAKTGATA